MKVDSSNLSQVTTPHRSDGADMKDNKLVLDPCCGSRMFWFDRQDTRAVFGDIRSEEHVLKDRSSAGGSRKLVIAPDQQMDFRYLPFDNNQFHLVVFDPPHLMRNGKSGWLAKKYGKLGNDWREDIRAGFTECFRVLKPNGTLIFKWNEEEVKVSELLSLTPEKPLFGNRCGKTAKSHWIVFMKPEQSEVSSITSSITSTQNADEITTDVQSIIGATEKRRACSVLSAGT